MKKKVYCPYCGHGLVDKFVEGRIRRYCESCTAPVYENPVPASCIVTVDTFDRILLVKRSVDPKKGQWCLPGGFMELGETPEEAGLRELKEETGIDGKIEMLLGLTTHSGTTYDTVLITGFLVREYCGIPLAGDDADDVGWFKRDCIPEIAFPSHKRFINIYYSAYASSITPGS
jgi:8-oxo-dGTP diphosphatase